MSERIINRHIMFEAAKRYAASNKSDPFAYSRAMSHINRGIAQYIVHRGKDDIKPGYAEEVSVTRELPDGT